MDYEKKYKEALERAKDYYEKGYLMINAALEKMFPELNESEDETIRKELINFFKSRLAGFPQCEKYIAWLEKQGEQKSKMKPKWLYRLEYKDNSCGLWYNGDGKWCFESGIGSLDDSCKTKSLPMDYDERYKQDGRDWFSSCTNKDDLLHWYSKEDAKILMSKGFVFTRYLATEYHEYEQQTVFIKETSLYREEIDFFSLFENQKPVEWSKDDEQYLLICKNALSKYQVSDKWDAGIISRWLENKLKSTKDRVVPLPKQEWVEQDYHIDLTKEIEWVRNRVKKGEEL